MAEIMESRFIDENDFCGGETALLFCVCENF